MKIPIKTKKYCLAIFIFTLIFILNANAEENNRTVKKVYRVAIDQEYAPYEYLDNKGHAQGFTPNVLREIEAIQNSNKNAKQEIQFNFISMSWPEALLALESGKVDIVNMIKTSERESKYELSVPHSKISQALFRNHNKPEIKNLDTLTNLKIGFQKNDISFLKLENRTDFKKEIIETKLDGLLRLNVGSIDAFFCSQQAGVRLISEYKLTNIQMAADHLFSQDYVFAVRKGNTELIINLNKYLEVLQKSGQLEQISKKWLEGQIITPNWLEEHRTSLIGVVSFILFILFITLIWNSSLRKLVQRTTKELATNESFLQAILNSSEVGIAWANEQGQLEFINPKLKSLFGYALDEISTVDQWFARAYPDPAYRDIVVTKWNAALARSIAEKRAIEPMDVDVTCKDGSIKHVNIMGSWVGTRILVNFTDITERKAIEEKLYTMNRDFVTFLENTDDFIYFKDEKSRLRFCSQTMAKITGYKDWREMIGKYVELFPKDTAQIYYDEELPIFKEGKPLLNKVNPYCDAKGEKGWVMTSKWPVFDLEEKKVIGIFGISRDITEIKKAELASEEALGRLQKIANWLPGVVFQFRLHPDGKMSLPYASNVLKNIYGLNPEDVKEDAAKLFLVVHPEDLQQHLDSIQQSAKNLTPWNNEYRLKFEGHSDVWLQGAAMPELEEDGSILWHGFVADITERKKSEIAIQEASVYSRTLIEASLDPLMTIDSNGKIMDVNHATEKATGTSRLNLIGSSFSKYFTSPERATKGNQLVWEQGDLHNYALSLRNASGAVTDVLYNATLYRNKNGEPVGVFAAARDITKQKEYEQKLKHAMSEAEAANKAKSSFLASMSHEIRTPLNSVVGLTEVLLDSPLNEEQKRLTQVAHAAGENLLYLINDILDISRVESGALNLENIPFFLSEQIENSVSIIQIRAREKSLMLKWTIEHGVSNCVIGDPTRLRQILINLLGNAVKFSEKGEIKINVARAPTEDGDGKDQLLFSVSDQGIGIDEDKLEVIFESFKQVDNSITRRFGGSGLGLAISKKLIEMMHGKIWVKSSPGNGSTFFFTAQFPAVESMKTSSRLSGARILIHSEDPLFRYTVNEMLQLEGARAVEAANETEALDCISTAKNLPFNFIISRSHMVNYDIHEFVKKIRAIKDIRQPDKIVCILKENSDVKKVPTDLGIFFEMLEPFSKEDLIRQLERPSEEKARVLSTIAKKTTPLNILLVEDSKDNRLLIEVFLKGHPHKLTQVENGLEGVQQYTAHNFDLVLMDVQMPVMDGYTATREIRKWESETGRAPTPILALTAHAFDEDVKASKAAGCTEHVTKPLKKAKFLELLDKYGIKSEA